MHFEKEFLFFFFFLLEIDLVVVIDVQHFSNWCLICLNADLLNTFIKYFYKNENLSMDFALATNH